MTSKKMVCIDIPSFEKVIENLVSNAIKYNKPGGEVSVEPFVRDNFYGITVRDTGMGIPEDELSEIFKEFYRSKEARKREQLGTGLGLTLVKQIVDQFGGKVTVESKVGKGSIFTVELPFIVDSFN
jgi:two-component system phosphate regulon sensor histidine kinase PhoR